MAKRFCRQVQWLAITVRCEARWEWLADYLEALCLCGVLFDRGRRRTWRCRPTTGRQLV